MDIRFRTRRLRRICNSRKELKCGFGDMADVIQRRLQVLAAASHLGQVPHTKPIRRHELIGARSGEFAVDLLNPHRLVFTPDHNPVPLKPEGGIDINAVTAIEVVGIVDYH